MLIDNTPVSLACPVCEFHNTFTIKQARLKYMIICRGCKTNIQLDDRMNECRKAIRQIERTIAGFEDSLKKLNLTIKIKL
jgi:rRNA maturation endonuclease Nob1